MESHTTTLERDENATQSRPGAYTRPKRLFAPTNRTREGRFLKHAEAQLAAQLGGSPSFAQAILIRRAARAMLQLEKLDEKIATGAWTDHDARTYGGLGNNLRLTLRELGLKSAEAPKPVSPLAEHFSRPPVREAAR